MRQLAIVLGFGLMLAACGQGGTDGEESQAMDEQVTETQEASAADDSAVPTPPDAEQIDHEMTAFGVTRNDPYYWMRDRENPEVISYLEAENAYAAHFFDQLADVKDGLFQELISHLSESRESAPFTRNGYSYATSFAEGADYPVISRTSVQGGEAQVLLDEPALAEGHDYFVVSDWDVAGNNEALAYSIDTNGRELFDITMVNLSTGEQIGDVIADTDGSVIWSQDGSALYYLRSEEETLRPYQLWRHVIGTPQAEDQMLYQEDDPEYLLYIERTKSGRYLTLTSWLRTSTEVRLVDLTDAGAAPVLFEPRRDPHQYFVDHVDGTFFIRSDEDAMNYQVFTAADEGGTPGDWTLLVPHRDDTLVQGMEVFDGFMVLEERSGGNVSQHVYNLTDGTDHTIDVGGEVGYATFTEGASDVVNVGADAGFLRFEYSSYNVPTTIYDYVFATGELIQQRQEEVGGGFNPANYETARVWAPAEDGTMIPVTLAWRRDMGEEGAPRPLMLRGYGAYGSSYDPTFTYAWLPLMDHGIVLATAHIRGGAEMGRQWYYDGRLQNKMNTFTDYIDAADFLVGEGWTTNDQMIARGGSAGGLLLGAVVNMRPELFQGVLNHVPFVDVITTMSDPTIPLTTYEWVEWGNPIENEDDFNYMLSYSPYDQLEAIEYPNMFITAGLNDPRVQYWEPAKYVARVRDLHQGDNILLFKTNMGSGHFGTTGRFSQYEDIAEEITFMMWVLGMTDVEAP